MEVLRQLIFTCFVVLQTSVLLQGQTVEAQEPFLIFTDRDSENQGIMAANLDGSNKRLLINSTASGLDFDYREETVFWSNIFTEKIYRSAMNGSFQTVLVDSDLNDPEVIEWDWINKKLYWTDVTKGTLEVMDPETGYRKVLLSLGRNAGIRGLQLDPHNRWLYWSTFGDDHGKIAKMSMDGTETMVLHDSSIVTWPNGITLDSTSDILYWMDAAADRQLVGKSRTELGSPNMTLFKFPTRKNPFQTTYYNGGLYYTDWITNSVRRVALDSTPTDEEVITLEGDPGTVRVFAAAKQRAGANPCGTNRGGCSQLCLLSASDPSGYSCACDKGVKLNPDRRTCPTDPTTDPVPPTSPTPLGTVVTPSLGPCGRTIQCENGGTCHNIDSNRFLCECPTGFTGTLCETDTSSQPQGDNTVLIYVLGVLGILAFMAFVTLGLVLLVYLTVKMRAKNSKHRRRSSIDGLSTSSRDSPTQFVLVNGRMSEHDYMSIKSRGNSPAPGRILICNVGDQGTIPNNYIFEPRPVPMPASSDSQTLDQTFSTQTNPEPIYNTVKSTKRQTL